MVRPWCAVAGWLLALACTDPAKPPYFAAGAEDAASTDAVGGAPDAAATTGCDSLPDAALCPAGAGGPPIALPATEPAARTVDPRDEPTCTTVPGFAGFYTPASLFAIGDQVYVFSVDASDVSPRVLLHVSPLADLAFGEPTTLLYGAHEVDLLAQTDGLRAAVGRQFYTVELVSSDGTSFEEAQQVGPHEPTYRCDGYPPPRYFRGPDPVRLLAVGSDYNDGLFGCHERLFVSRRQGGAWPEPVEVARGDAVFAFQSESLATIVTNVGVLQSTDDGITFEPVAGLDAAGGAFTGTRLVLARASSDGIRALHSTDEGATWSVQELVIPEIAYGGVFIAADGASLSMMVATDSELVSSTSFDDAATWTDPARIARPPYQRLLAIAQRDDATLWLTAGFDDSLELCVRR